MQVMKWSIIALAVAAGTTQMAVASEQSESKGFVEDSSLTLINRNYYFNHDGKNGAGDGRDWSHAVLTDFNSGFTQGTVGFGVDLFAYLGLKLDEVQGGAGNVPIRDGGDAADDWSHVGGAVKLRISNTVLKYGQMAPTAPVFAVGGSRIFPQTATGFSLISSEIEGLDLNAGHFTSTTGPRGQSNHEPLTAGYAGVDAKSADYLGGSYAVNDNMSISLYGSEFEDIWRQYYGNVNYALPLSNNQALTFDINIYRTLDEGSKEAGDINNTTWSLAGAYSVSAHTFTLAYQQVRGDTPFDYIGTGDEISTGDSIFLANSIHVSDFNGPSEKSWQARYDLNMSTYGAPGLSFMTRYVKGWDADGTKADGGAYADLYGNNGKHHELDLEARYVVQSGPAKDLSLRFRQAFHRGNSDYADGDTNQTRLMIEYPLSIL
ncbi:imipenem/basic amino acid-specific outer membrane pore [Pseudomonas duriflava]|uniref:Imipenem/basic amino acid-specific outer membrane pore n=1 Tax=Pseudomonas duriflava TaxID=459528 RepID=A0A562QPD4_9PSED|nr:OprD family porin [Pseudomonas duriflava]TWI58594.1 imipenem/basic amino acid-specific outer membrane pore [Pseudomonas duriflava]